MARKRGGEEKPKWRQKPSLFRHLCPFVETTYERLKFSKSSTENY